MSDWGKLLSLLNPVKNRGHCSNNRYKLQNFYVVLIPKRVYVFVRISEQAGIILAYNINWLVFVFMRKVFTASYELKHKMWIRLILVPRQNCGSSSSVGIATDYRLDGPGIEKPVGARFFAHVQNGPGAHAASCTMGIGSFPGVKLPGRGADNPHPSSAKVENE
jgi:hypothetical protein